MFHSIAGERCLFCDIKNKAQQNTRCHLTAFRWGACFAKSVFAWLPGKYVGHLSLIYAELKFQPDVLGFKVKQCRESFVICGRWSKFAHTYSFRYRILKRIRLYTLITFMMIVSCCGKEPGNNSTDSWGQETIAVISDPHIMDVAGKGIKTVIFPGDMTDDGQIVNQEAVKAILQRYEQQAEMTPCSPIRFAVLGKCYSALHKKKLLSRL